MTNRDSAKTKIIQEEHTSTGAHAELRVAYETGPLMDLKVGPESVGVNETANGVAIAVYCTGQSR